MQTSNPNPAVTVDLRSPGSSNGRFFCGYPDSLRLAHTIPDPGFAFLGAPCRSRAETFSGHVAWRPSHRRGDAPRIDRRQGTARSSAQLHILREAWMTREACHASFFGQENGLRAAWRRSLKMGTFLPFSLFLPPSHLLRKLLYLSSALLFSPNVGRRWFCLLTSILLSLIHSFVSQHPPLLSPTVKPGAYTHASVLNPLFCPCSLARTYGKNKAAVCHFHTIPFIPLVLAE